MATKAQREYLDKVYNDAIAIGIPETQARLAASQSAIETGYGEHAPGNAYFGMKAGKSWDGPVQSLRTQEEENGALKTITDNFRVYDSPQASLADWWERLQVRWPEAATATDFDTAVKGLKAGKSGGYATDSSYPSKLNYVNERLAPRPPGNIPGVASQLATGDARNLAGGVAGTVPPSLPRARPEREFNPLPAPAPLTPKSYTLPPPNTALNPAMPARPNNSWPGGSDPVGNGPVYSSLKSGMLGSGGSTNTGTSASGSALLTKPKVTTPAVALPKNIAGAAQPEYIKISRQVAVPAPKLIASGTATAGTGILGAANLAGGVAKTIPKTTYKTVTETVKNPKYVAPVQAAPAQAGGFNLGGMLGGLGSNIMGGLNNATEAVKGGVGNVQKALTGIQDAIIAEAIKSPAMRGAVIDPMVASIFTKTPMSTSPTRYGATFADRQLAAQNRERLTQGLPPLPGSPGGAPGTSLALALQKPKAVATKPAVAAINNAVKGSSGYTPGASDWFRSVTGRS